MRVNLEIPDICLNDEVLENRMMLDPEPDFDNFWNDPNNPLWNFDDAMDMIEDWFLNGKNRKIFIRTLQLTFVRANVEIILNSVQILCSQDAIHSNRNCAFTLLYVVFYAHRLPPYILAKMSRLKKADSNSGRF